MTALPSPHHHKPNKKQWPPAAIIRDFFKILNKLPGIAAPPQSTFFIGQTTADVTKRHPL